MNKQSTNRILMIEPVAFGFNSETATNNYFQKETKEENVQALALSEFRCMVDILRSKGICVEIFSDTSYPHTPDSIFPNNWISFHEDGTVVFYPMFAVNRRSERREDILQTLQEQGLRINRFIDYSAEEFREKFLEGTGSMVLDRSYRRAYACLSPRTDRGLFLRFCDNLGYKPVYFDAVHSFGQSMLPIYHTNVMMAIGTAFAVICLESVVCQKQKAMLVSELAASNREIIEISYVQMSHFAGNILEVEGKNGELFLCMSQSAYNVLMDDQKSRLRKYVTLLPIPIPTIERLGGGSVRCMMAEVFTFL